MIQSGGEAVSLENTWQTIKMSLMTLSDEYKSGGHRGGCIADDDNDNQDDDNNDDYNINDDDDVG